ncbi:MAG: hypothetical protein Q7U75_08600 [Desulfobacterales bacterium]|nr:hypothetical protein [Desulfobacterales bacterium]
MNEFYATRAGRTFFDVTMPRLVAELARMNALLEKLVEQRPVQVADPKEPLKP